MTAAPAAPGTAGGAQETATPGVTVAQLAAVLKDHDILVSVGNGTERRRAARPRDLAVQLLSAVDSRLTDDPAPEAAAPLALAAEFESRAVISGQQATVTAAPAYYEGGRDTFRACAAFVRQLAPQWDALAAQLGQYRDERDLYRAALERLADPEPLADPRDGPGEDRTARIAYAREALEATP